MHWQPSMMGEKEMMNYMAKDYESFRQSLLELLTKKFPEWNYKSDADARIMLVELFSYIADELSYYQDRVANEAFLRTARKRFSVGSHLNLVDYRLHNGCSAIAFIKVVASSIGFIPKSLQVSSYSLPTESEIVFETDSEKYVYPSHNELKLVIPDGSNELKRGVHSAYLGGWHSHIRNNDFVLFEQEEKKEVVQLIEEPVLTEISIESLHENFLDGKMSKPKMQTEQNVKVTKITWSANQSLQSSYDSRYVMSCTNIIRVTEGMTISGIDMLKKGSEYVEDFVFKLKERPLAFVSDSLLPYLAKSSLEVWVDNQIWEETGDLLDAGPFDKHFTVSVDDEGYGQIRFGDGINGKKPLPWSTIRARYRTSLGSMGNVGRDVLRKFDRQKYNFIASVTNPLPAIGGTDMQSIEDAKITGPRTLKFQERAITGADYASLIKRKFPQITDIRARIVFTGSWNTVIIAIDAKSEHIADSDFLSEVRQYANKIKTVGNEIRLEFAKYVYVDVGIVVYLEKKAGKHDVERRLRNVLGNANYDEGKKGFFHPDNFSFGQPVYVSKLYDAINQVRGISSALITKLGNHREFSIYSAVKKNGTIQDDISEMNIKRGYLPVDESEIIRLNNDPLHLELGLLTLEFVE